MKQPSTEEERSCLNIISNKIVLLGTVDSSPCCGWTAVHLHTWTQPGQSDPTLLKPLPTPLFFISILHRAPCGSRLFRVLRDCLISSGLSNKSHCAFRRLLVEAEAAAVKEKNPLTRGIVWAKSELSFFWRGGWLYCISRNNNTKQRPESVWVEMECGYICQSKSFKLLNLLRYHLKG